jgi:hypothetical protein
MNGYKSRMFAVRALTLSDSKRKNPTPDLQTWRYPGSIAGAGLNMSLQKRCHYEGAVYCDTGVAFQGRHLNHFRQFNQDSTRLEIWRS